MSSVAQVVDGDDDELKNKEQFAKDGYLVLSNAIKGDLLVEWQHWADGFFQKCFEILNENGHTAFPEHSRSCPCPFLGHNHNTSDDKNGRSDIEYALGLGVKHGFYELVMRSPGRYEISLLHIMTSIQHNSHNDDINSSYNNRTQQQQCLPLPPSLISNQNNNNETSISNNNSSSGARTLVLEQLLDNLSLPPIIPKLLDAANFDDLNLCHVSLIVSTPGSALQKWHADGGHVNIEEHASCHCLNVFIPLVDVPRELGPTEFRPGTHYHTRDLTKMMLLAKIKKTLRPPTLPTLSRGDVLIFDYRVLHRGLPNISPLNKNRSILVFTFSKPWFRDVCNFPTIQRSMFLNK